MLSPTLQLTSGRDGWRDVEASYQRALEEISEGHPDDAITDATTALQDTFRVLGCEGKDIKALSAQAVSSGRLKGYDSKIVDWTGADRSQSGDGHTASGANLEDAWFTVHIPVALILRLATGGPRQS